MKRIVAIVAAMLLLTASSGVGRAVAQVVGEEPDTMVLAPTRDEVIVGDLAAAGSAVDDDGVRRVRVAIRDQVSRQWLQPDGSFGSFVQHDAVLSNPDGATTDWTLTKSLPNGSYGMSVRAVDVTGQVETSRPWVRFTVASVADEGPVSVIDAPVSGAEVPGTQAATGTATDDGGVVAVRVAVRDRDSGLYLDGDGAFAAGFRRVEADLDSPGATATGWVLSLDLPVGRYSLSAKAVDDGGQVEPGRPWTRFTVADDEPDPIRFRAIADTPYNPFELTQMQAQIPALPAADQFLVHLGDIKAGGDRECGLSYYENARAVLLTSPVPAHIIPGDNEWNDCLDPAAAWAKWQAHFSDLDQFFSGPPVQRQSIRPENFAFVQNDVAFIGINLVGGRILDQDAWDVRHAEDAAWIDHVLTTVAPDATSAVVFGHAYPVQELVSPIASFGKPVLYMMGDFHQWRVDTPYPAEAPLLTRVVLDRAMPGVSVTVTHDPANPWILDQTP